MTGKLVWGVVLLTIGILGFLDAIDLYNIHRLWHYWPVVLIIFGVSGEIDALRNRQNTGAFTLIAVGVWFLAGTQHFLGLNVGSALPLGLAVAGLGVIVHAIVDVPQQKKESDHEPC